VKRVLATAAVCLALAAPATAAAPPLATRLAQALAVQGVSRFASSAIAVDLADGRTLFARNPDLPLAPASNEKLTVTFAALSTLGPDYTFETQVVSTGHQVGSTWIGNVYLKGYGDPTLTSDELEGLVQQLQTNGIDRIEGRVLGDESWFDSQRTAPGWKSDYYVQQCAPISALTVDGDVVDGRVALDPPLAAAQQFRRELAAAGIAVGASGVGAAPEEAAPLAQIDSEPLSAVLAAMDVNSDNRIAEMLLKDIGAEIEGSGTTAAGAAVVRRTLAAAGIPLAGVRIVDGSGLSADDRLTARAIATLLVDAWDDPSLRQPFWAALPVAGMSGTLQDRMERRPARGAVHAKTGTTDRASALSGYVSRRYAFAVIDNGRPVATSAARRAQDRFATALASAAASGQ
jgi:D-alanyl-D-alanine carboxypeptidase/D-alanyl-D-alanine-endopeptidase (penicillin-binding protein 4)